MGFVYSFLITPTICFDELSAIMWIDFPQPIVKYEFTLAPGLISGFLFKPSITNY